GLAAVRSKSDALVVLQNHDWLRAVELPKLREPTSSHVIPGVNEIPVTAKLQATVGVHKRSRSLQPEQLDIVLEPADAHVAVLAGARVALKNPMNRPRARSRRSEERR